MTIDHNNQFIKNVEVLIDVSQFMSQTMNSIISLNDKFAPEVFASSKELLLDEINAYKVYDC